MFHRGGMQACRRGHGVSFQVSPNRCPPIGVRQRERIAGSAAGAESGRMAVRAGERIPEIPRSTSVPASVLYRWGENKGCAGPGSAVGCRQSRQPSHVLRTSFTCGNRTANDHNASNGWKFGSCLARPCRRRSPDPTRRWHAPRPSNWSSATPPPPSTARTRRSPLKAPRPRCGRRWPPGSRGRGGRRDVQPGRGAGIRRRRHLRREVDLGFVPARRNTGRGW